VILKTSDWDEMYLGKHVVAHLALVSEPMEPAPHAPHQWLVEICQWSQRITNCQHAYSAADTECRRHVQSYSGDSYNVCCSQWFVAR
jgi:hypothetical protein